MDAIDKLKLALASSLDNDGDEAGENEPPEGSLADKKEDIQEAIADVQEAISSLQEVLREFSNKVTLPLSATTFTTQQRKNLANKGQAMPDGSFPIRNVQDLKDAIRSIGRAKNPAAAKAHIKSRAKALGATNLIPAGW